LSRATATPIRSFEPCQNGVASGFGNFELDWSTSFALHYDSARSHGMTGPEIPDPDTDQIAATKLAVDGQIEEGEIPQALCQLQADADCPDVFPFERWFLPHQ
jgi:hypothetical protein